jgi:AcrR family transcriptional regulator
MNAMSTEKRRYELKARAEDQARTRQRIVEATSALHEEVGPARTTVAEIARRAGVQRLTVYNHFPDEAHLFDACGRHWLALHPPPDPSAALQLDDPSDRLRMVLRAYYAWYRENAAMQEHVQRDRLVMPVFDSVVRSRTGARLTALVEALTPAFSPSPNGPSVRAAVALALDFWAWRRLSQEGLSDLEAADVMVGAVESAASKMVAR